jgi:hypothetical protein
MDLARPRDVGVGGPDGLHLLSRSRPSSRSSQRRVNRTHSAASAQYSPTFKPVTSHSAKKRTYVYEVRIWPAGSVSTNTDRGLASR